MNHQTSYYDDRVLVCFSREQIFERYPELLELYYYDANLHLVIDALCRSNDIWSVFDLIKQLLLQNRELSNRLTDAIYQGFRPSK